MDNNKNVKEIGPSRLSPVISDLWVSCTKPSAQTQIRLFCFPYAGAGSTIFNAWSNLLLPEIELYLVHLPGREKRIKEAPYKQLLPLTEKLTEALYRYLDRPFAFFGHSMGALVSFEVVRQLRSRFSLNPVRLIVSGKHPPHVPDPHPDIHHLPDDELITESERLYGSLPKIISEDLEVLKFFLPIMRADFTLVETYQYLPAAPLECPITVFGGDQDNSVSGNELSRWSEQTVAGFNLKMFPGNHFFIQDNRGALVQEIKKELILRS